MMKPGLAPPWLKDVQPDAWVELSVAARFFRRSRVRMHQWIQDGTFKEANIPTYFDGTRWYVRIPDARRA